MKNRNFLLFLSMISLNMIYGQQFSLQGGAASQQTFEDQSSGYVGIGTPIPTSNLTLSGFVGANAQTTNGIFEVINPAKPIGGGSFGVFDNCVLVENNRIAPVAGSGLATTQLMTDFVVRGNGNTGVGVALPTTRLHIYGDRDGGVDLLQVENGSPALYVTAIGRTGIGTTTPTRLLDVAGDASIQTRLYVGAGSGIGLVDVSGDIKVLNSLTVGDGNSTGGNLTVYNETAGNALNLVNGTNYAGWSNQINFKNQAGVSRHIIIDDNTATGGATAGNLVLYPGIGGGANGTVSVLGNETVSGILKIGNVTTPAGYGLYVEKGVLSEHFKCALKTDAVNWSDYVFDKGYKLAPLADVETYIKTNKHLPDVPSAKEVYANGIDMAQMDATLLQKIEELTLYVIDLKRENGTMKAEIDNLKK